MAPILAKSRPSPGDSKEDSGEGQSSSPCVIPGGMGQCRSKRRAVQFQGVPGGVACSTIPGKAAMSRSTPVGSRRRWCELQSVVYTRVAWETAITKSNLALFMTGHFQILFIPGHFQDSVYTRSLLDFVYKRMV